MANLEHALQCWLEDCEAAGFAEALPVAVLREAWLGAIDQPTLAQRFVSGGVTFCTLMPMRAVPFRVVCLLGMNDGDYPRRAHHADFDLLNLPQLARPGDRSRRDDDRYLMLEALLAAREKLYVSWVGRNVRDNSEQPSSVLVSQLRDYLQRGWDMNLEQITTEHPLQPFSRRYFEEDGLLTFAREWRAAHEEGDVSPDKAPVVAPAMEQFSSMNLAELARFLRQPVKYFFRHRLQVVFAGTPVTGCDEEPFGLDGLEEYGIAAMLLDDSGPREKVAQVERILRERTECLARQGVLPIGLMGRYWQEQLVRDLTPVRSAWLDLCSKFPQPAAKLPVVFTHEGLRLDDWIDRLRSNGSETVWLEQHAGKLTKKNQDKQIVARPDKLFHPWMRQLAAAVAGQEVTGYLVGRNAILKLAPLDADEARQVLGKLMTFWRDGLQQPLPVPCKTALRLCEDGDDKLYEAYDGGFNSNGEVMEEPCLARLWPDFSALNAEPQWRELALSLYQPLLAWRDRAVEVQLYADEDEQEGEAA
jgi:exodeoxyribonuclease V gamma subunit